ncbi:MAG: hypothetical protein ACLQVJ_24065 [Syntrophobacteraceae bacterium]
MKRKSCQQSLSRSPDKLRDYYNRIWSKVQYDLVELSIIPNVPSNTSALCEEALEDLLEIRGLLNIYIRATRKEKKRLEAKESCLARNAEVYGEHRVLLFTGKSAREKKEV